MAQKCKTIFKLVSQIATRLRLGLMLMLFLIGLDEAPFHTAWKSSAATVRWVDCMERLFEHGGDFFIELGPGTMLASLLQRIRKGVDGMNVGDAESVRTAN